MKQDENPSYEELKKYVETMRFDSSHIAHYLRTADQEKLAHELKHYGYIKQQAWNNLYEDFKKLDKYNVNLREENKRYRKALDELQNEKSQSGKE